MHVSLKRSIGIQEVDLLKDGLDILLIPFFFLEGNLISIESSSYSIVIASFIELGIFDKMIFDEIAFSNF